VGRLEGRIAIVTGASRGLGRSIAELFAAEGAAVAVVARTEVQWDPRLPGTVHDTVAAIERAGGKAIAVPADLAKPEEVDTVVERTKAALGTVDILVNNAALTVPGRPPPKEAGAARADDKPTDQSPPPVPSGWAIPRSSFLAFPLKGFRLHFEIGLMATYRLMQLVLPDMIELGRGSIVNISSLAAYSPGPGPYRTLGPAGSFAYGGNKAAMHHLTQAVAAEMQQHGVPVNALMPSEPVLSPGNLYAGAGAIDYAIPERFAEATLQVALADPTVMTGQLLWSEDVLHPELGNRGWLPGLAAPRRRAKPGGSGEELRRG
jgi:NAD(P)-dependent dehydrogenase (short-subunit alcohol dehydrogenase family)